MNVLVNSFNLNFARPIIEEIERRGHTVIYYALDLENRLHMADETNNIDAKIWNMIRFNKLMSECDIVYCEFIEKMAFDSAMWKQMMQSSVPIVCRAHRIEMYSPRTYAIPWHVIDDLVFIADHMKVRFNQFLSPDRPRPRRQHTCYNGYDSELFSIPEGKEYNRRIIYAGGIYWKKDLYSLVEAMSSLEGWSLDVIGNPREQFQGQEYMINVQDLVNTHNLGDRVHFKEHMDREEFAATLGYYDVIVSSSLEEGCHCSVAEAMLCGVYPLLRHWNSVEEFFPEENVFENWIDFKHKLEWWYNLSDSEKRKASEHYRLYIEKRFDEETQARKFVDILEESYNRAQEGSGREEGKWWQT